jgi:carboxypeptidase C (cathepsin A)
MLFIDQPTQVGFSYSIPVPGYVDPTNKDVIQLPDNNCPDYAAGFNCGTYSYPNVSLTANSTPNAAPNFWKTLQGFMGVFPQYDRDGFYFTTESYGGHYGPTFNEYIEQQNAALPYGAKQISLKGVLIGNGWYDPAIQYAAYYNFTVNPGSTYDFQFFNESIQNLMYNQMFGPGNCLDMIHDCYARGIDDVCSYADNFCFAEVENIYDIYAGRDEYDSRELMPDPFPPAFYVQYLNTPEVQQAIGAYVNFTESNNAVSAAFGTTGDDGRKLSILDDMKKLLDQGVTLIMYTGDADYNCNWYGGEVVSHEIGAPGYEDAGYVNVTTSDGIVHGQVKQSGSFAFLRIYESGHEVPFYQPVIALEMLERVMAGKDIATGVQNVDQNYKTVGTQKSTYREGNGTVQMDVVPTDDTYNTTTNAPNPYNATNGTNSDSGSSRQRNVRRSLSLHLEERKGLGPRKTKRRIPRML